jgi:hypothetical protein
MPTSALPPGPGLTHPGPPPFSGPVLMSPVGASGSSRTRALPFAPVFQPLADTPFVTVRPWHRPCCTCGSTGWCVVKGVLR